VNVQLDTNGDGRVDSVEGQAISAMPYQQVIELVKGAMLARPLTIFFKVGRLASRQQ
jgi:hypothetical protein